MSVFLNILLLVCCNNILEAYRFVLGLVSFPISRDNVTLWRASCTTHTVCHKLYIDIIVCLFYCRSAYTGVLQNLLKDCKNIESFCICIYLLKKTYVVLFMSIRKKEKKKQRLRKEKKTFF